MKVAKTSCNQLLLIDSFCYIYANQDLFASCHNIAISLYNIIMYICSCMCGLGYIRTYVLPVCHLQELTAIPSGTQVMSLVFDWISKDLKLIRTFPSCPVLGHYYALTALRDQLHIVKCANKGFDVCRQSADKAFEECWQRLWRLLVIFGDFFMVLEICNNSEWLLNTCDIAHIQHI